MRSLYIILSFIMCDYVPISHESVPLRRSLHQSLTRLMSSKGQGKDFSLDGFHLLEVVVAQSLRQPENLVIFREFGVWPGACGWITQVRIIRKISPVIAGKTAASSPKILFGSTRQFFRHCGLHLNHLVLKDRHCTSLVSSSYHPSPSDMIIPPSLDLDRCYGGLKFRDTRSTKRTPPPFVPNMHVSDHSVSS